MADKNGIPELGPLEFQLLRLLWRKAPSTARQVLERYNRQAEKKLKYTTVMTLLTRMVEKGVLTVDRSRQPFYFRAAVGREQMLRQRIVEFVELFFEGRALDLAVRLVEENALSAESIERLEGILRKHRQRAGD